MPSVVQFKRKKRPSPPRRQIGFRAPLDIVEMLDRSADYNFRSVNADIVERLRESFAREGRFVGDNSK